MTTEAARAYLENARWPNGPVCPACDSPKTHPRRSRPGLHRCQACDYEFTVRSGTIIEHSRVPLEMWVQILEYSWRADGRVLADGWIDKTGQKRLHLGSVAFRRVVSRLTLAFNNGTHPPFPSKPELFHRILSYRPPPKSAAAKKRLRERKQREFAEQQQ